VAGLAVLRSREPDAAVDEPDLLLDVDAPAQEVDVLDAEPEHLALAQTASGGHGRQRCVPDRTFPASGST
jgi:hypothetical protein